MQVDFVSQYSDYFIIIFANRSLWKHFRAVSLCLFLLVFPAYMSYMICQFFHMDFWLLIIISSSILTSLQVLKNTPSESFFHGIAF